MIRATVASISLGPVNGIVVLKIDPEELELLQKGALVELVLSPSLPTSPSVPSQAAAASTTAMDSEGDSLSAAKAPTAAHNAGSGGAPREDGGSARPSPAEDLWDEGQAGAFRESLAPLKMSYRPATDALEHRFGMRPSAMSPSGRLSALQWLHTAAGRHDYGEAVQERERLAAAIRDTPKPQRQAALERLGWKGKSPSDLSARQLKAVLLEVETLPPETPTQAQETQP